MRKTAYDPSIVDIKTALTLDYSMSTIGNTMGLSMLDNLEQRISLLTQQLAGLRRPTLDEWSGYPETPQNAIGHGGNISMDIQAIGYMHDGEPLRAHKWEAAFSLFHDITYTEARETPFYTKVPAFVDCSS